MASNLSSIYNPATDPNKIAITDPKTGQVTYVNKTETPTVNTKQNSLSTANTISGNQTLTNIPAPDSDTLVDSNKSINNALQDTIASKEASLSEQAPTAEISSKSIASTPTTASTAKTVASTASLSEQLKTAQTAGASNLDASTNLPKTTVVSTAKPAISTAKSYKYLDSSTISNLEKKLNRNLTDAEKSNIENLLSTASGSAEINNAINIQKNILSGELPSTDANSTNAKILNKILQKGGLLTYDEFKSAGTEADVSRQNALIQGLISDSERTLGRPLTDAEKQAYINTQYSEGISSDAYNSYVNANGAQINIPTDIESLVNEYKASGVEIPEDLANLLALSAEQKATPSNITDVGTGWGDIANGIPLFEEQLKKRALGEEYVVYQDPNTGEYSLITPEQADALAANASTEYEKAQAAKTKQIEYDYNIYDSAGNIVSIKAPENIALTEEQLAALPSEDLDLEAWFKDLQYYAGKNFDVTKHILGSDISAKDYDTTKLMEWLSNNDPTSYATALALKKANEIGTDYFGFTSLNRYYQAEMMNKINQMLKGAYDFSRMESLTSKYVGDSTQTLAGYLLSNTPVEESKSIDWNKMKDTLVNMAKNPGTYSNLANLATYGKYGSLGLGALSSLGTLSSLLGVNKDVSGALSVGGAIGSGILSSGLAESAAAEATASGLSAASTLAPAIPVLGLAASIPTLINVLGDDTNDTLTEDDISYLGTNEGQNMLNLYMLLYNPSRQYEDMEPYSSEYLSDWTNGKYTGEMSKINWASADDANAIDFNKVFGYDSSERAFADTSASDVVKPEMYWKNLNDYALQRKRHVYLG